MHVGVMGLNRHGVEPTQTLHMRMACVAVLHRMYGWRMG